MNIFNSICKYFCKDSIKDVYLDDKQVLEELDRLFPPLEVTPETSKEKVMFNAGQRRIISHIRYRLHQGR